MNKVDLVDRVLPQTQCKRCGYASCRPYAEAIVLKNENINRCPPGGEKVMSKLASHMRLEKKPIAPECGIASEPKLLFIDETQCIGCGLCLPACPVDAIAGATKFIHTILKEECTGCELCIAPCPVDCIKITNRPIELSWNNKRANDSRIKFERNQARKLKREISGSSIKNLDALKKKYIKTL